MTETNADASGSVGLVQIFPSLPFPSPSRPSPLPLFSSQGMADNVLSDTLWAKAVMLTSPAAATVGLSLTVPLAIL